MDDPRTRAALDSLADIFLTGTSPAAGTNAPPAGPSPLDPAAQLDGPRPIRLGPKLRSPASPAGSPMLGDRGPVVAQASTAVRSPLAPTSNPADPQPQIAAGLVMPGLGASNTVDSGSPRPRLRLQPAPQSPDAANAPDRGDAMLNLGPAGDALVEAVFLGNLPGFGGPWLTQYARSLATGPGPVAVLRVEPEQITVELVGAPQPPPPQDLGEEDAQDQATIQGWAAM